MVLALLIVSPCSHNLFLEKDVDPAHSAQDLRELSKDHAQAYRRAASKLESLLRAPALWKYVGNASFRSSPWAAKILAPPEQNEVSNLPRSQCVFQKLAGR